MRSSDVRAGRRIYIVKIGGNTRDGYAKASCGGAVITFEGNVKQYDSTLADLTRIFPLSAYSPIAVGGRSKV